MRNRLVVFFVVGGLIAVPAALAATTEAPARPGERQLARFPGFEKQEVRQFRRAQRRREARERRQLARKQRQLYGSVAIPPQLEAIAACESGGNPSAVSSSGTYRGKYQFSYATWAAVGGSGDPAAASEAEQDYRAALLYERSGPGQWPVCGA